MSASPSYVEHSEPFVLALIGHVFFDVGVRIFRCY